MTSEAEGFIYVLLFLATMGGIIFSIILLFNLYSKGVRKLFTFNKTRRAMINNIIEHAHTTPTDFKLNGYDYHNSGYSSIAMILVNDMRIGFKNNLIFNKEYKAEHIKQTSEAYFINMTLEERIRMKKVYKFLSKWYKNRHENESVERFYISSTRFDEL